MRRIVFSVAVAVLMTVGFAYAQDATRPLQANRITIELAPDALKDISILANEASLRNGVMYLKGDVRINVGDRIMKADAAVITSDRLVLEGRASVYQSAR